LEAVFGPHDLYLLHLLARQFSYILSFLIKRVYIDPSAFGSGNKNLENRSGFINIHTFIPLHLLSVAPIEIHSYLRELH